MQIEIHGDCIAVLIGWRISEMAVNCFFLVDWKDGKILLVSELEHDNPELIAM